MVREKPARAARVFISSASGALDPYRAAAVEVCQRLGLVAVCPERSGPGRLPPVDVCRREVEGCDALVLLLGHRYGSRPEDHQTSYTELEYAWAAARPGVEVFAFLVKPGYPWPPGEVDRGSDEKALRSFVAKVKARHTCQPFGEIDRFREDLVIALRKVEVEPDDPADSRPGPLGERTEATPGPPALYAVPPYVGSAPFTGRASQLGALDAWAASADPLMVVEAIGGTGKSALTWEWTTTRAPLAIDGLAGRLWWSFYDGSASIRRFLQEAVLYTTRRRWDEIRQLSLTDLSATLLAALRDRPYLLVLDGFERLLTAYHRFDPSKLRDDEVPAGERSLIEPHAHQVVRALTTAWPSRVLISSRLMPDALEGRFGQHVPGVAHVRLPGLTDADTVALLGRLGVRGDARVINGFFRQLGNHPLLVGIVAGLVRDYRREPGAFDRWRADPAAGGAFALSGLKLTERQSHILAAALDGLEPDYRRLLGWISVLVGSVDWPTLEAINPFAPERPVRAPVDYTAVDYSSGESPATQVDRLEAEAAAAHELAMAGWRSSEEVAWAGVRLDLALKELEDRGLLWWDRDSNTYDLHPIVRAVAHDQLDDGNRIQANERISAHFEALPDQMPGEARSVEELRGVISLFRALVGSGRFAKARRVWSSRLRKPVLLRMGATAVAIELLTPLGASGDADSWPELGLALTQAFRHEEALQLDLRTVVQLLEGNSYSSVLVGLSNVAHDCAELGKLKSASRYLALRNELAGGNRDRAGVYAQSYAAVVLGQADEAIALIEETATLEDDVTALWAESNGRYWRLYVALRAGGSLTEERLDEADRIADTWLERRNLQQLRRDFFVERGEFGRALEAAYECDRIERDSGMESVPAATAHLLARLGRTSEAVAAVDESLGRLSRIDAAIRPHYHLALALKELGRRAEAVTHARKAYRQAWGEGPPYCRHWDLLDVKALLAELGEPEPELPVSDETTWQVPFEAEIRAFISEYRKQKGGR